MAGVIPTVVLTTGARPSDVKMPALGDGVFAAEAIDESEFADESGFEGKAASAFWTERNSEAASASFIAPFDVELADVTAICGCSVGAFCAFAAAGCAPCELSAFCADGD